MTHFTNVLFVLSPVVVLTTLTACGSSSGLQNDLTDPGASEQVGDNAADTTNPGTSDDGDVADAGWGEDCTYNAFPVQMAQATQNNDDPSRPLFVYQGRNIGNAPFDELQIASYQGEPYNGPKKPGSYSLDGNNYQDCALCALLIMECDNEYRCEKVFFADEGTLDVAAMTGSGGLFKATLDRVVFREVTIDTTTYESTPVAGGDTWCLDGLELEVDTHVL